ncbi:MAG: hypothetical protein CSA34_03225 [Desulfobulbus propionicus]|nr:MAG: hypothetical protein CSA34_03225 [Desulfobulbus propionicus]
MRKGTADSLIRGFLWTALGAQVLAIAVLAWVPPVSRDALTHHLFVPRLYLEQGGIHEIPAIAFSYYPMNLDLLYLLPLYLGNDILAKYIHFFFALLTCLLIYRHLHDRVGTNIALLGCVTFLSTPIITKLSVTVYVDLGLIFFTTASLLWLLTWIDNNFPLRRLVGAGLFCGLAMGTKYNGLVAFVLLTLMVPLLYLRCATTKPSSGRALLFAMIFALAALTASSPWLIRNYLWTSNPIYPLHNTSIQKILGDQPAHMPNLEKKNRQQHSSKSNVFLTRKRLWNETWWQTLLLPLRFFFEGEDDNPRLFDGKLNPLLLLLPVLLLFLPPKDRKLAREQYILAAFAFFFFFYTFFQQVMRIRYISPILPALVILAMTAVHSLATRLQTSGSFAYRQQFSQLALIVPALLIFSYNTTYTYELYKKIDPLSYITGKTSRNDYIAAHRSEYPVVRFINNTLTPREKVLCLFLGNRGYYMGFTPVFDRLRPGSILFKDLQSPLTGEALRKNLETRGIFSVLLRGDLTQQGFAALPGPQKKAFHDFFEQYLEERFSNGAYTYYTIRQTAKNTTSTGDSRPQPDT